MINYTIIAGGWWTFWWQNAGVQGNLLFFWQVSQFHDLTALRCSPLCVQGWRGRHHYRWARPGHENFRLVAVRGRVAGADRRGRPGWQWLHHLQRVRLVDDKVALWLWVQWGSDNNNNTSREIHDGDIEEEIREAFRWIFWLILWMTETIRLFENLCLSRVWLSMCP